MTHSEQDLHDVIRMLVQTALIPIGGGDDKDHCLEFEYDGDGWNEPFSEHYGCHCGEWQIDWVQSDPEQSGRPDPVDAALAWRKHVLDTWPEEEDDDLDLESVTVAGDGGSLHDGPVGPEPVHREPGSTWIGA